MEAEYKQINTKTPKKTSSKRILIMAVFLIVAGATITGLSLLFFKSHSGGSPQPPQPPIIPCPSFIQPANSVIVSGCTSNDMDCIINCSQGFYAMSGVEAKCSDNATVWKPTLTCQEQMIYFLAIGDWGVSDDSTHTSTTTKPNKPDIDTPEYNEDKNAQEFISKIMGDWADLYQPKFIISHGDNFYWNGLTSTNDQQLQVTFEERYSRQSLYVPWYTVMGNHDYGGGAQIGADGGQQGMLNKLHYQTGYSSPNNDRWKFQDSYYVIHHDTGLGFTIDIFNIDTNAAINHGFDEICCQCYGNTNTCDSATNCNAVECSTGCAPLDEVNSCRSYLTNLWNTNMANLERDLQASTATWKVINSHYGPRLHMSDTQQTQINEIITKYQVHLFMFGHTHGEGHEYDDATKCHYILNGAGGGYQKNGASMNEWSSTIYAFVSVMVTPDSMKIQFVTFDSNWGDFSDGSSGGSQVSHCWIVPNNGGIGEQC